MGSGQIGAGALMTEANGIDLDRADNLRDQMVDLIKIVEGFYACGVAASGDGKDVALLKSRDANSGVRAWLEPNFRVELKECDGTWCEVIATSHPAGGSAQSFDGYLPQGDLWGVYKNEVFD